MSDVLMNVHTCATETTNYTMLHVRSLCQIYSSIYTHVLLITLPQSCFVSDLMMNVNTCFTDSTTYTMMYVKSLSLIQRWMYTHVLLITLLTSWCISYQCFRYNSECTHVCYWYHYWHHGVSQIILSDLTMNLHTCVTDSTTYTMLKSRSLWLT